MKRFFSMVTALALLLSLFPIYTKAQEPEQIQSGYYGIDRQNALIGQIPAGVDGETFLSRVFGSGELTLTNGIATGSVLRLSVDGQPVDSLTLAVQADVNRDGAFSVTDMLMVKSKLLDLQTLDAAQTQAADVSGDGKVTITDFLQMKSKLLKLSDFEIHDVADGTRTDCVVLAPGETMAYGPAQQVQLLSETESEPTEPATEATEPSTEPTTEPATEPSTEPTTEPTTEPSTEPTTEPATEPSTEPPAPAVTVEGNAVVWDNGVITAVSLGTARVSWEGQVLLVTVCAERQTVSLPKESAMEPGSSAVLQPRLNHRVETPVSYSVSDSSILQVDASGNLKALANGTATVTAQLPNGESATQTVRVMRLIHTVELDAQRIKVKNGSSKTLTATVSPADTGEKLIWSSSDPSIAKVDAKGVVTGLRNGTVVITCASEYGGVKAACEVKVCNLIQVALTFDDGPSSAYTGKVLDMLQKYDIDASFFLVGNRIKGCEKLLQRMVDEGHEIGYHTWSHGYFYNMTLEEMKQDYRLFLNAVEKACTGEVTLFRAPGGGLTDAALANIPVPHIMWSVDTRDWETRDTTKVKNAIIAGLKDGAIILLHDIHYTTYTGTMAALEYIFENDLDVEFMTVTELLSRKGTPPKAGKSYHKG